MAEQRLLNKVAWQPEPETDKGKEFAPLYFLAVENTSIYFVNNTPRILDSVKSFCDTAEVQDGKGATFLLFGPHTMHSHDQVLPQEAVLIGDLDSMQNSGAGYQLSLHAPYLRKTCITFKIPDFFDNTARHALLQPGDKRYKLKYARNPEYMFLPAVERRT